MSHDLPKLYHEIIKQHHKEPYHFEKKEDADITLEAYNPLCGDRFKLFLYLTKDPTSPQIKEIYFHGYGCSVSRAATSVLAQSMEGKCLAEGLQLCQQFLALVDPEVAEPTPEELLVADFEAFRAARAYPGRISCATLSWQEAYKIFQKQQEISKAQS